MASPREREPPFCRMCGVDWWNWKMRAPARLLRALACLINDVLLIIFSNFLPPRIKLSSRLPETCCRSSKLRWTNNWPLNYSLLLKLSLSQNEYIWKWYDFFFHPIHSLPFHSALLIARSVVWENSIEMNLFRFILKIEWKRYFFLLLLFFCFFVSRLLRALPRSLRKSDPVAEAQYNSSRQQLIYYKMLNIYLLPCSFVCLLGMTGLHYQR